ncbi:MAG: phosphatidate cytidylyltransferase [Spirochaetales bacterium]|nr:phosphatidate cytidylyltransferase [Spirochaetales bacterium]
MSKTKSTDTYHSEIKTELFRKSIHVLVAFVPALATINIEITQLALALAVVLYSTSELMRLNGRQVLLISGITAAASRERDKGHMVLGPVTLAVGAMLALMLYPLKAAEIAIYALAFGDSAASIVGTLFGKIVIPGFGKKTLEGTLACFAAVFIVTFSITQNISAAFIIASAAALIELIPIKDLDNLLIPVGTGLVAVLIL